MPNRILKETICTSDSLDALSWFEEVLFYRLIVNCDDYGCFDGRVAVIKNRLFPLKESLTTKTVSAGINKLASVGLVVLYEFEGKPFLCLPTWKDHQNVRAKKRKYPDPESGCMHLNTSEIICNQMYSDVPVIQSNPIQSESNPNTNPKAKFTPPTFEEVRDYVKERNSPVDPKKFFDYYDAGGWKDAKGNPVRNWKQKLITWEKDEKKPSRPYVGKSDPEADAKAMEQIKRLREKINREDT